MTKPFELYRHQSCRPRPSVARNGSFEGIRVVVPAQRDAHFLLGTEKLGPAASWTAGLGGGRVREHWMKCWFEWIRGVAQDGCYAVLYFYTRTDVSILYNSPSNMLNIATQCPLSLHRALALLVLCRLSSLLSRI